jgi:hypothetical protein
VLGALERLVDVPLAQQREPTPSDPLIRLFEVSDLKDDRACLCLLRVLNSEPVKVRVQHERIVDCDAFFLSLELQLERPSFLLICKPHASDRDAGWTERS